MPGEVPSQSSYLGHHHMVLILREESEAVVIHFVAVESWMVGLNPSRYLPGIAQVIGAFSLKDFSSDKKHTFFGQSSNIYISMCKAL